MKKQKNFWCLLIFTVCLIADLSAGGMMDTLGEFETETQELTEDTAVKVGRHEIMLQAGSGASFYVKNGSLTKSLYMGRLAEDAVLSAHGKTVTVPATNVVWFYENGELKYTSEISEPTAFQVQGRDVIFSDEYDIYRPLGFHRNGQLYQGMLYEPTKLKVQNNTFLFKGWVCFSEDGHLTYGILGEDAVFSIQGKDYHVSADNDISLYADGTVKEAGLPNEETLFQVGEKMTAFISVPTLSSTITFHPNGNVMFGCLAKDTAFILNGKEVTVTAKTISHFNEDGSLYQESGASRDTFIPEL